MTEVNTLQRFSPGDTIRIDMEFHNNDGVDDVYAFFVNSENLKHTVGLYGNGEGSARSSISMQARAATNIAPGEYLCQYIRVSDVHGNYAVSYPARKICFRVSGSGNAYEPEGLAR